MTREDAIDVLCVKAGKGEFVRDIINQIFDEHEAQLKAKDEEIERLKAEKECAKDVIDWYEKEHKQYIKLHHQKARSIVAMLFWEAQEAKRICGKNSGVYTTIRGQFDMSYKMLKDIK